MDGKKARSRATPLARPHKKLRGGPRATVDAGYLRAPSSLVAARRQPGGPADAGGRDNGASRAPRVSSSDCTIANIVGTAFFGHELPLEEVAWKCAGEYNKGSFAACLLRLDSPSTTALVFGTGRVVVTGAATEQDLLEAIMSYFSLICLNLPHLAHELRCLNVKVQNIVAHGFLGAPVDLGEVYSAYNIGCAYQPELFPGVRFKINETQTKALVFLSGQAVITGARTRADVVKSWDLLCRSVRPFFVDVAQKHEDVITRRAHERYVGAMTPALEGSGSRPEGGRPPSPSSAPHTAPSTGTPPASEPSFSFHFDPSAIDAFDTFDDNV